MKKPTIFGKYLLLERINVGGMAEVFIAKAFGVEGFERILAIKKILPTMAEDEEFITMFIDEARISVQLNHANVVHIHELGRHDENYFIAMEYVAGKDIRSLLERYRRRREIMPTAQAVFIASKMCEGLDYAHRKKDARGQPLAIIHRDISPQNILCSYEGEVKIIDFGIAKAANRSQKTQAGILKGKFGYMSPEQVRGLPIDRRSDIFAVGVILYEMLTGEKLFVGESDFSTLEKVRNADVPLPTQFNPSIPPGLEKVVLKALAREAEDRYQWASDLQEDLMRFLLAGDQIYSAKHLSAFMKEAFVEDLAREAEKMERYAAVVRPDQIESSGVTAPVTSAARPSRRPSQPEARPAGAARPTQGGVPAARMSMTSVPAVSTPASRGAPYIPPPSAEELEEMDGPGDKTQIVSEAVSYGVGDGQSESPAAGQARGDRKSGPKVILGGSSESYGGATTIGPVPTGLGGETEDQDGLAHAGDDTGSHALPTGPGHDEHDHADPSFDPDADTGGPGAGATRMLQAPDYGDEENPPSQQSTRMLQAPDYGDEENPASQQSTRMLQAPDYGDEENPASQQSTRMLDAPRYEDEDGGGVAHQSTRMLEAPDYGDEPEPGGVKATQMLNAPDYSRYDDESAAPAREVSAPSRGKRQTAAQAPVAKAAATAGKAQKSAAGAGGGKSRTVLLVAAVGAAALLAVVAAAAVLLGGGRGEVVFMVTPFDGAQVFVDGAEVPAGKMVELEPGQHELQVTAQGYRPEQRVIEVVKGPNPPFTVSLTAEAKAPPEAPAVAAQGAAAAQGSGDDAAGSGGEPAKANPEAVAQAGGAEAAVAAQTVPAAAQGSNAAAAPAVPEKPKTFTARFVSAEADVEIQLAGRTVGKTPAEVTDLEVGKSYAFTAKKTGFKNFKGTFTATEAGMTDVRVALEPSPEPAPVAKAAAPKPAPRPAPAAKPAPAPKVETASAKKPAAAKATGSLACSTRPAGAQVIVGTKNTGRTTPIPRTDPLVLPVGNHVIKFVVNGKTSAPQMVTIREGETALLVNVPVE